MRLNLRNAVANMAVVIMAANMSAYFMVSTLVMSPCTVNPSMGGPSAIACAATDMMAAGPRVSYSPDPGNGDMVMTVEF
jgi:hypothetical protein